MCVDAASWNDEWRSATRSLTEMERAHPVSSAAGMHMDEREDITADDC